MKEQSYKVSYTWRHEKRGNPTQVEYGGNGHTFRSTFHSVMTETVMAGDFVVTVDIGELVNRAVHACARTKGGKGVLVGGLVTAKRIAMRKMSQTVSQIPLPDGYRFVEEAKTQ